MTWVKSGENPGFATVQSRVVCKRLPVSNPVFRFATVQGSDIRWSLGRNCSLRPIQLGLAYLGLCGVSLSIGAFFWLLGAPLVLPFAWLELVVVGLAFVLYARHAADTERISLGPRELVVEWESAGRLKRVAFRRDWVRIEPDARGRDLIEVSAHGRSMWVGRYVRPELRPALATELRMALRLAPRQAPAGG